MKTVDVSQSVGTLVADNPSFARIFEQLGIDYCCGGQRSLDGVCREKGLDSRTVQEMLQAIGEAPSGNGAHDLSEYSLPQLIEHIVDTHHAYLREELPRLGMLMSRVASHHGKDNPVLIELERVFEQLSAALNDHMEAEEQMVFPMINALYKKEGDASEESLVQMEEEHDEAGSALAKMRELTGGYRPPHGACNSYRALFHGLEQLEKDMHQHVHKENNILFPRARDLVA